MPLRKRVGRCRRSGRRDGNKRTAPVAAATFLMLNGQEPTAPEAETVEVSLRLAEGGLGERALAGRLERSNIGR